MLEAHTESLTQGNDTVDVTGGGDGGPIHRWSTQSQLGSSLYYTADCFWNGVFSNVLRSRVNCVTVSGVFQIAAHDMTCYPIVNWLNGFVSPAQATRSYYRFLQVLTGLLLAN